MPLYRKYISAVTPLPDYILRVDFVSGSRLLLDMKPYLDKLRFRPLADPAVWNSAMTKFCPWRNGRTERADFSKLRGEQHEKRL